MKTRKQYLDHEVTHDEYYGEIVDSIGLVLSDSFMEEVRATRDQAHFNTIPLYRWDAMAAKLPYKTKEVIQERGDYLTQSGGVCIVKAAARKQLQAN